MGLEVRRRCGFLSTDQLGPEKPVWLRGSVVSHECPKSFITAESIAMVERFYVRKEFGGVAGDELSARDAEGFVILQKEWQMEQQNGK
jgi:hypothetical protein